MANDIRLRPMRANDVPAVRRLHLRAFPGFFLSFLGPRFLSQLYAGIVEDETGIAIVAVDGADAILGFVAGTTNAAGFYRRLLSRRVVRFALASVGSFIRKPSILPRLLRALLLPGTKQADGTALLMSVAVDPGQQGRGVGGMLNDAFLAEASRRGSKSVILTTDRLHNDSVNAFYERAGYRVARTFVTPEGRHMNEYEIALHQAG